MSQQMHIFYNEYIIFFSLAISVLVAYFALDLTGKLKETEGYTKTILLVGGSVFLGIGLWSIHFIAMLALDLGIRVQYEVGLTALSLLMPILSSFAALSLTIKTTAGLPRLGLAGLLMGAGISLMHYIGIAALRFMGNTVHDPKLVGLTVGFALIVCILTFLADQILKQRMRRWKMVCAVIIGLALSSIHFAGMSSVTFIDQPLQPSAHSSLVINPVLVAVVVGLVTVMIMSFAIAFANVGKQLQSSQSHHRSLFEENPDMVILVDPRGTIQNINPSVLSIAGYEKEWSVGRHFISWVHPEDRELFQSYFFKSVTGDCFEFVIKLLHANRTVRDVFIRTVPMMLEDRIQGIYIIGRDITETKAGREQFERLSYKHSLILNSISEGVYGIDEQGRTIFWNAAAEKMTGYAFEEVANRKIHELIHHTKPDGTPFPEEECSIILSARSGIPFHDPEDLFWRKDGTSFVTEYQVFPLRDTGGLLGAVVTFNDITERKKTEELILSSEKLSVAGQLAAGIAHEIRNPLTAIKGFLQLMKLGEGKPGYLDVVFSEMDRIELIINELLFLAKPQPSQQKNQPLEPMLDHVVALLESQANFHNIELVKEYEDFNPTLLCDGNQLKQVFINMIKNSIESMSEGGTIHIRTKKRESGFSVEVEDQGCGIPPERLQRLGEPFYSTKEKGTGLGFMVSRKIIETHGGTLHVTSEVNIGTRIEVRFET